MFIYKRSTKGHMRGLPMTMKKCRASVWHLYRSGQCSRDWTAVVKGYRFCKQHAKMATKANVIHA